MTNQPAAAPTVADVVSTTNATIRAELARRNLRQTSLVDVLGISQVQVNARFRGDVDWRLEDLVRVAHFLGLPVARLFEGEPVTERTAAAMTA